jgi:SAM-dependent methyltransferase
MLQEPLLAGVDIDSAERISVHRAILERKPTMQRVCREMYRMCAELDAQFFSGSGARIELGAGVSFLAEYYPDVLLTDLVAAPHLDSVLDGQDMRDVADCSVRAFYAIFAFHHFSEPRRFFSELERTLVPGGGCVLIEPAYGPASRALYPLLFASERFDMREVGWESAKGGPMSLANQALSHNVFVRDRSQFEREFPRLRVVHHEFLRNYLRYLLSGGLNFRSLVPAWSEGLLIRCEDLLAPLRRWLALHQVIVLRKAAVAHGGLAPDGESR